MKRVYTKYFIALLLFGLNGIVASQIAMPSVQIVFWRTMIGSIVLSLIFVVSKGHLQMNLYRRQYFFLFVSGAAMGASWMFLYEAYQRIGVSLATLAYYCGPVLVMALSPAVFREKLTWRMLTGFLIVLAGAALINGQAIGSGKDGWGICCAAISAVLYALMVIFNKKAYPVQGLENALVQLMVSFFAVAIYMAAAQKPVIRPAASDWLPVLALGAIHTGLGCYCYFSAIGTLPAQTVALCGYLEPLGAVLFSAVFLDERLLPAQILGAAMVLGGACLGQTRMRLFLAKRKK